MRLFNKAGFFTAFFLITLVFLSESPVQAEFIPPSFPACPGGSGNIKANYPEGQHAIIGVTGLQFGSDKVFSIADNNFLQCYCPPQGSGTQTDWLAADNISQVDKNNLITQGWVLIPNGADWGLQPIPYLAKNSSFSCGGGSNGGGGGSSGGGSGSSGGSSGGSSSSSSSSSGGQVLGISTLAATTSESLPLQITIAVLLGSALIAYGTYLKKGSKKAHPPKK